MSTISNTISGPLYLLYIVMFVVVGIYDVSASTPKSFRENQKGIKTLTKKPELARQHFAEALRDTPDDSRLHFNLGNAHYYSNNYNDAITAYQDALAKIPEKHKANTYYNLGTSHLKNQEIQDAISNFKQALEHNPQHLNAKHNLEIALQQHEQTNTDNSNDNDSKNEEDSSKQRNDVAQSQNQESNTATEQASNINAIEGYIKEQEIQARQNYIKRHMKPQNPTEESW